MTTIVKYFKEKPVVWVIGWGGGVTKILKYIEFYKLSMIFMFKGLIYEKLNETKPIEIKNTINNAYNLMTAKNMIIIKEKEYYYVITNNDNLITGITYDGIDVLFNGFRKEKIDFEKIEEIYFVDVEFENSQISNIDVIIGKCGLINLNRKF